MRGAKRGVAGGRRAHLGGRCVLLLRAQQGARPARPSDDHDHDDDHDDDHDALKNPPAPPPPLPTVAPTRVPTVHSLTPSLPTYLSLKNPQRNNTVLPDEASGERARALVLTRRGARARAGPRGEQGPLHPCACVPPAPLSLNQTDRPMDRNRRLTKQIPKARPRGPHAPGARACALPRGGGAARRRRPLPCAWSAPALTPPALSAQAAAYGADAPRRASAPPLSPQSIAPSALPYADPALFGGGYLRS